MTAHAPDGYTTTTVSDRLAAKLTRIMMNHGYSSYAEAIKYAADKHSFKKMKPLYESLFNSFRTCGRDRWERFTVTLTVIP